MLNIINNGGSNININAGENMKKTISRVGELASIMIIVWMLMMLMLLFIDRIIVPITIPIDGTWKIIFESIIKLLMSGATALLWLFIWIQLVEKYVSKTSRRNDV